MMNLINASRVIVKILMIMGMLKLIMVSLFYYLVVIIYLLKI